MPYFSFHLSADETIRNASRFLKEAGAAAVKIEGASPKRLKLVEAMVEAEIPVMGHVGLTPQSIHQLGRYRVQGTAVEEAAADRRGRREPREGRGLRRRPRVHAPWRSPRRSPRRSRIPTIGIGAGPACDGQVLVFHDMVGFSTGYMPKFVKKYADLQAVISGAVGGLRRRRADGRFPDDAHSYHLKPDVAAELAPKEAARKGRRQR